MFQSLGISHKKGEILRERAIMSGPAVLCLFRQAINRSVVLLRVFACALFALEDADGRSSFKLKAPYGRQKERKYGRIKMCCGKLYLQRPAPVL